MAPRDNIPASNLNTAAHGYLSDRMARHPPPRRVNYPSGHMASNAWTGPNIPEQDPVDFISNRQNNVPQRYEGHPPSHELVNSGTWEGDASNLARDGHDYHIDAPSRNVRNELNDVTNNMTESLTLGSSHEDPNASTQGDVFIHPQNLNINSNMTPTQRQPSDNLTTTSQRGTRTNPNHDDRFELFILGEGETKVTMVMETRVPNAAVFTFKKEDHTLGNLLRYQLLKHSPVVMFAAYKVGHPLIPDFDLRIQTDGTITPKEILVLACREVVKDLEILSREFTKEWELKKISKNAEDGAGGCEKVKIPLGVLLGLSSALRNR